MESVKVDVEYWWVFVFTGKQQKIRFHVPRLSSAVCAISRVNAKSWRRLCNNYAPEPKWCAILDAEVSNLVPIQEDIYEIYNWISFIGAFEVQVNDTLVHSKLSNLAFPDYNDVARNIRLATDGKPVEKVKEQPITDCTIQ